MLPSKNDAQGSLIELQTALEQAQAQIQELQQRQESTLNQTLRAIVEGTAPMSGNEFFKSLVQYLAISLQVRFAFVGELTNDRRRVRTLAFWGGDSFGNNIEFDLQGTPCEAVLKGEIRHYPDQVHRLFSQNELLQQLNVRSYLAVPMIAANGTVLGHLAALDDKPMRPMESHLSIFHIFAARATAELVRAQAESILAEQSHREKRILEEKLLAEAEVACLRSEIRVEAGAGGILGVSDPIRTVLHKVEIVAPTASTVLIVGETGTGKELIARAIHAQSQRAQRPLIKVNCAALPENLIESELFGHERGAFTGALAQRKGRFELAHGGTLFLDEIGELPLSAQSRLLRVLQEQEFERVGGSKTLQVDVRLVTATNRNLREMVAAGRFREDLFYRLNVFPLELPPLRERKPDIPLLAQHFVQRFNNRIGRQIESIPGSVMQALLAYDWPGNIRELQNVIERAVISSFETVLVLPPGSIPATASVLRINDGFLSLEEVEKQHILTALRRTRGVVGGPQGAAQLLGMKPNTLRSRLLKMGIQLTPSEKQIS